MNNEITTIKYIPNLSEWCDFCQSAAINYQNDPCRGCMVNHNIEQDKNPKTIVIPKRWALHSDYHNGKSSHLTTIKEKILKKKI